MPGGARPTSEIASRPLEVVLFSGGRGSGGLTRQLVSSPGISLTLAINGYDDGASTGEVRRFLGDSLGPSDFRKNASRLAGESKSAPPALIDLFDARLPAGATQADVLDLLTSTTSPLASGAISEPLRTAVFDALRAFLVAVTSSSRPFQFGDCSLGNLVFAGLYLQTDRAFNRTVDRYAALLGLREGLLENVTAGENAWLVGLDANGRLLATEAEIVDAEKPNRIRDIFLVDGPLTEAEVGAERGGDLETVLRARAARLSLNPRLAPKIAGADLIIYAPGTQHSSLFPSYMTPGLSAAIARNLAAIKLLVTNIQSDAEIAGSTAVDLIERAVYYMTERRRLTTPVPCLITHYLVNDPRHPEPAAPYVPLGPVEGIEDPRLVRIGNYEDGVSGRHDALKVLGPFLDSVASRHAPRRVAVLLYGSGGSANKLAESLLEMVRGGVDRVAIDLTVFYSAPAPLATSFVASLPFEAVHLAGGDRTFDAAVAEGTFDYLVLFESSGMYRGEDVVALLAHLPPGRLDAVWGSRRLSVRDIEESYRLRYRKSALLGAISYVGSYALSLAYLLLYGRYVSDTLSAVRAVRAAYVVSRVTDFTATAANHVMLTLLLRNKAELLEIPVRFVPLSPDRVARTTVADGLRALVTIVGGRFASRLRFD